MQCKQCSQGKPTGYIVMITIIHWYFL